MKKPTHGRKKSLPPPRKVKRWPRALVIIVLLVVPVAGYLCWRHHHYAYPVEETSLAIQSRSQQTNPPVQYPLPVGDPQHLTIVSTGIDVPMGPVSLPAGGGELVPPFDIAAWYADGPKPGFPGPAVVVGHVDSTKGPNVFWNLHKVKPGDKVVVQYPHQKLTFVVTRTQTSPQDALPISQIWDTTSKQVLRLVTCIGDFNYSTHHYSDNYIVYAKESQSERM